MTISVTTQLEAMLQNEPLSPTAKSIIYLAIDRLAKAESRCPKCSSPLRIVSPEEPLP